VLDLYFKLLLVLTPNDFTDLPVLEMAILKFQDLYNEIAKPFKWKYTKDDLRKTLSKIEARLDITERMPRAA
jgi:hypothetical protein